MEVKYDVPAFKNSSVINLDKFMGVDFRTADTQVNFNRSPYSLNMIAGDNFYYPKKRNGYKKIVDTLDSGNANGIHQFTKNGVLYLLLHFGTSLYRVNVSDEGQGFILISSTLADNKSKSFVHNGECYILDGTVFLKYDGQVLKRVSDDAFIPTTTITRSPTGDGTVFEAVNLLTAKRKNSFAADGSSKVFTLDTKELDSTTVTAVVENVAKVEGVDFTVNRNLGTVTFNTAPIKFSGPDNVVITFSKTISGNEDKINKCRYFGIFGGANNSRFFLSGNKDSPNIDYSSGLFDPSYFPDTGYTKIGSDDCPIIGYVKQYNAMLIMKNSNFSDASIYLRTFELDQNYKPLFPVQQGISGVCCISNESINILEDIPLFLSNNGVYAVVGSNVYMEKALENRSAFINSKLLVEENLSGACSAVFEGKYYLCVNNKCYVADSRQKYYDTASNNMQYEWYFWDNIPAKDFCSFNSMLYFIGSGKLYRFYRNDEDSIYNDDGVAIKAIWRTPLMNLGKDRNIKKVIITLQPFTRSSCELWYMSDKSKFRFFDNIYTDIVNFSEIDFNRFTFNTFRSPKIWEEKCYENHVNLFSIELVNDRVFEGFGFYSIVIMFM